MSVPESQESPFGGVQDVDTGLLGLLAPIYRSGTAAHHSGVQRTAAFPKVSENHLGALVKPAFSATC
jgi:hypothetical protein